MTWHRSSVENKTQCAGNIATDAHSNQWDSMRNRPVEWRIAHTATRSPTISWTLFLRRRGYLLASWPQAASMSCPRERRTVTVTPACTSAWMNRSSWSSGVRWKGSPSTGL